MKKILSICLCFLFVISNIEAKEFVYKTKLHGDFIFNDTTNKIIFGGKTYVYPEIQEIENGFKMYCIQGDEIILFELYKTNTGVYLVEYKNDTDDQKPKGATLYYEGIGEIDVNEIASNIVQNKERYLDEAGVTNSNDRAEVMKRVADAIRLINKGGVRVSASGTYTFTDPGFDHLKSTGQFNKKLGGAYKKDDNYYNNLAFSVIGQAARSGNANPSYEDYTPEELARLRYSKLKHTQSWRQVLKAEVISYDMQ